MEFVARGVTAKVGGYRPIRAEMSQQSELVRVGPDELEAPQYGVFKIGDQQWAFILDEPAEKPARLYVDTNGDGDLTNDPEPSWTGTTSGDLTMFRGEARVKLADGNEGTLGMYRFDPNDTSRAQLKNTLLYYTDFGYEVAFELDGTNYSSFVSGLPQPDSSFWIDRDGNGRRSAKREMVYLEKPFNFTGTTYVVTLSDNRLFLNPAAEEVPVTPLPPDLAVGKQALEFTAKTMDGNTIDFPKPYAGKIVLLDFWATWCGPCIAELPHLKQAYGDWHEQGFEVLGVSFDNEDMTEKLQEFIIERDMPWPQIYEGKGWNTSLGELYDVSSIPFVLLVDGDTGEILATARELRGPGLTEVIGKVLNGKRDRNQ